MKKITFLFLLAASIVNGQDFSTSKNTIYLEAGGSGNFYSFNYDRILIEQGNYKITGRVGAGYLFWLFTPVTVNALIGKKNHFTEIGGGYTFITGSDNYIYQTVMLGYRYQRDEGGLIFRIGYTPFIDPKYKRPPNTTFNTFLKSKVFHSAGISVGYTFKNKDSKNIVARNKAEEKTIKPKKEFNYRNILYLGVEGGIKRSMVNSVSENNTIFGKSTFNSILGVTAELNLNKKIGLEVGIINHDYSSAYSRTKNPGFFSKGYFYSQGGTGYNQFPTRIKVYIPFSKKIYLHSFVGMSIIQHKVQGLYRELEINGYTHQNGDTIFEKISSNITRTEKLNYLIEAGSGISFYVKKKFLLSVNGTYLKGWKEFNKQNIEFYKNNVLVDKGTVFDKGNSFNLTLNFKMPIGRFAPKGKE